MECDSLQLHGTQKKFNLIKEKKENIMSNKPAAKPKPSHLDKSRCQFTTADNRQCRMLRFPGHKTLCALHAQQDLQLRGAETASESLLNPLDDFRTVATVNQSLGRLYTLLARNRIPVRNAATLAYISQLLLQSLEPLRFESYRALGDNGPGQIYGSARRVHTEANFQLEERCEKFLGEQTEVEEEEEEENEDASTDEQQPSEEAVEVQS